MLVSVTSEQRDRLLTLYDELSRWMLPAVQSVASEAEAVLTSGREQFDKLLAELPYVDRPAHTMAAPMFACAAMLAVFEVLRERGIDAHAWGAAIHSLPAVAPQQDDGADERSRADSAASLTEPAPNEFVFETIEADEHTNRGMNITSCAICHLFAKHEAMELVPYMCAFDDAVSIAGDQGLRRTGSIALGAKHCDFRFDRGGEPLPLAEQYPDQIRLKDA